MRVHPSFLTLPNRYMNNKSHVDIFLHYKRSIFIKTLLETFYKMFIFTQQEHFSEKYFLLAHYAIGKNLHFHS